MNRSEFHQKRSDRRASGWLVTYADLMTILVCFFVLIVSYSIQDQVKMEVVAGSMRDAFGVAEERRYAGDIRLPGVPEQRQPGAAAQSPNPTGAGIKETLSARPAEGAHGVKAATDRASSRRRQYEAAKENLEKAILTHPILSGSSDAITINLIPEGLQIVLVDETATPMFDIGETQPTDKARLLLQETARALKPLANRIKIEAHADAIGAGGYSPFELTAARANAAREVLENAGLPENRIAAVTARGDAVPLLPEDPYAPGNRRIEIILEDVAPLLPENYDF